MKFQVKPGKTISGFTLAEILIVLGIIGLVAEYTIPTVIDSFQKTVYVSALKIAYSEANNVLKQMAADNGCVGDLKCAGLFSAGSTHISLGNEFTKYFKVIKNCGIATGQGCWPANTNINYDGSSATNDHLDTEGYYTFITANGMSYSLANYAVNGGSYLDCGTNWSTGTLGNMTQVCGSLRIDVNGFNGPNAWGRDTFWFWITNGKGALLYPRSGIDDNMSGSNRWWNYNNSNYCSSTGGKGGTYCSGRVFEKGWDMDY